MARRTFYNSQPAAAGTTAYTASAGTTGQIFAATACNPTGTDRTLDVHIVPDGASATAANQVYDALSVPQNSQQGLSLLINHVIPSGGSIRLVSSADASITVIISGDQSQ